jgi:hypothetical protein
VRDARVCCHNRRYRYHHLITETDDSTADNNYKGQRQRATTTTRPQWSTETEHNTGRAQHRPLAGLCCQGSTQAACGQAVGDRDRVVFRLRWPWTRRSPPFLGDVGRQMRFLGDVGPARRPARNRESCAGLGVVANGYQPAGCPGSSLDAFMPVEPRAWRAFVSDAAWYEGS